MSTHLMVDPATRDSASHQGIEHHLELWSNYLDSPFLERKFTGIG